MYMFVFSGLFLSFNFPSVKLMIDYKLDFNKYLLTNASDI